MGKRFFDTDNNFWRWIGNVPDMFALSLMWFVLCIPVVTIVPATIALYDAVARNMVPDEKGMYRRFFKTLKQELKRGILMSLLWVAIAAILSFGFNILSPQAEANDGWAIYAVVYQILSFLPIGVFIWAVALESRFIYGFWQLHKNAMIFTIANLPKTLLILVLLVLAIVACCFFPLLTVIMPALLMVFLSLPIEKAFKKFMPQEEE